MLNSLVDLSATLLSEIAPWDPASLNPLPSQQGPSVFLPDEPSTFALALIGIGIMIAYAALQRWRRPQQPLVKLSGDFGGNKKKHTKEQRKRGAA